jgi:WD40 repeat protein
LPVAVLPGHQTIVADVDFNPIGSRLVTGGTDRQILLWDVAALLAGAPPRPLVSWQTARPDIETGDLGNVHFIADDLVALGYLGVVEVWDVSGNERPLSIFRASASLTRDYDADSSLTHMAIAGQDGTGRIWDLETGAQSLGLARHPLPVDGVALSPHDRRIFTIDRGGQVRVWDARPQPLGEQVSISIDTGAFDLELRPDERQMALGNAGGPGSLWDNATFQRLHSLPGNDGGVYRVSYSPDGRRVAGAGKDNIVRVWDTATGELLLEFPAHGGGVTGNLFQGVLDVAFSPDGRRLATAGADGLAMVWDAATGRELLTLSGHTDSLYSLAFSPDGRYIATSSDVEDTTVKVWDAQTGEEIYTLAGHVARVWGLAFSPDSSMLVTGGARGIIKAWDMATGQEIYTVTDNSDHIGSIAFSPDGQFYLTTGEVPLRVRRAADGEDVLTIAGPILWSAKFSPDGRWIYAAGVDGLLRVFAVHLDDTIDLAYARLTRWWRPDECRRYLHTEQCPTLPAKFALRP